MADVQLKNGYIRIASELLEQFFIRDFSIVQLRILLLLLRYSYGCHKKTAKIKPQSLFNLAYVYDSDIKRELKHLERNCVISCNFEEKVFEFNKNYDEWKISYHKLFDEEKFGKLLHINLCCGLTKKLGGNKETEEVENESLLPPNKNISCHLTKKLGGNKETEEVENESLLPPNKNISCHLTKKLGGNKEVQAGNTNTDEVSGTPKDSINIVKDNNNIYINNNKPIDPYFGSTTTEFKKQYEKIFKKPCYLNNFQLQKLAEIPVSIPNFNELIPVLLQKFSKVSFNFDGEVKKPGLRWLIEEGNWADVLSGKFDEEEAEAAEVQQDDLPDSAYDL